MIPAQIYPGGDLNGCMGWDPHLLHYTVPLSNDVCAAHPIKKRKA